MRISIVVFTCIVSFISCQKKTGGADNTLPPNYNIDLRFNNIFANSNLTLGNTYTNVSSEPLVIQNFQYYISAIKLQQEDGNWYSFPESYFLVSAKIDSSKTIKLVSTNSKFKALQFTIGVDSAKNVSGVQTDALDPMNGMFWTWNSGYIMAKLEGVSTASTVAGNYFTYHIGGFRQANSVLRTVTLPFANNTNIAVGKKAVVLINADAATWFYGASNLKIADNAICHSAGALAMRIADNYKNMFTLVSVTNQ